MIVATTTDGRTRRFRNAERFAAWYHAAPRGLVRVVDISVAEPGPEPRPTPRSNAGPVTRQRH